MSTSEFIRQYKPPLIGLTVNIGLLLITVVLSQFLSTTVGNIAFVISLLLFCVSISGTTMLLVHTCVENRDVNERTQLV